MAAPVVAASRPALPGLVVEESTETSGPPVASEGERDRTETVQVAARPEDSDDTSTVNQLNSDDDEHTDAEAAAIAADL